MASRATRLKVRPDRLDVKCVTLKIGHATRALALDAAEAGMLAGAVQTGCHLMPYACDRCGQWHVRNERIVFVPPDDPGRNDYTRPR